MPGEAVGARKLTCCPLLRCADVVMVSKKEASQQISEDARGEEIAIFVAGLTSRLRRPHIMLLKADFSFSTDSRFAAAGSGVLAWQTKGMDVLNGRRV